MSTSIALVCESPVDRETVVTLVHRLLCDEVTWIEPDSAESFCAFRGLLATEPCLLGETVPAIAKARGQRFPGKFKGLPREAYTAFEALVLLLLLPDPEERPEAVLLIRDSDGDKSRRNSLIQARDAIQRNIPIVIGVAHTKRECWILAAFEPSSDVERQALVDLHDGNALGFDPRFRSHDLTAKHNRDKLSAKRVLTVLTGGERARETIAIQTIALDTLRNRGRENGLADFLAELAGRLLPLFHPRPTPE